MSNSNDNPSIPHPSSFIPHPSSFIPHPSSLIPLYYWRGGRPWLLDLEPDQTGWLICLCLHREGDISLLPLAWQINAPDEHDDAQSTQPYPIIHSQALEKAAVSLTLAGLQQDGWHITGRLTIHFTGRDTEANFSQTTDRYLWRSPGE
jgi:hypothetical protein